MKKIMIIRHASAEALGVSTLQDKERPLSEKGKKEATALALFLKQKVGPPDLMLVSPAVRTRMTVEEIASVMDYPAKQILFVPPLYDAISETLIKTLREVSDDHTSVWLVGHNPSMSELAHFFSETSKNLSTAGAVGFELPVDTWAALDHDLSNQAVLWFQFEP